MMGELYVLDKNLETVGIVDTYTSLIWVNRYNEVGDCEVYVEATPEVIALLQEDYYLLREDDDMICQIKRIELDTSAENGNYLIVSGYDVKRFLDQRIIWGTMTCDGNVETFIRQMIEKSLGDPDIAERQLQTEGGNRLLYNGSAAGFAEVTTEQMSYRNVGEKVREFCEQYKWGYKVTLENGAFYFRLYKGADRSATVIFSDDFENLDTTTYTKDCTNLGNVALVAGEGEGAERARSVSGEASGINRYEIFVDAKDISKTITWEELTEMYPPTAAGGQGYISGTAETGYTYDMGYVNIQIVDAAQLAQLQADYPTGQIVTIGGNDYYRISDVTIADLQTDAPQDGDPVILRDLIYSVYLLTKGYEDLAEFGTVVTFNGTVEPDVTFAYKRDYFLGDLVTVRNSFGITAAARIVEVTEVHDDNGYTIEPKFEYLEAD